MTRIISVVAHNIEFGGAATACRRLIYSFEKLDLTVKLFSASNGQKEKVGNSLRIFLKFWSAFLSRFDSKICQILEKNPEHWCSSGMLGQISARKIEKCNPLFINIHWIGHAAISLKQISRLKLPVVITAHDEWWLNAFSHYTTDFQEKNEGGFIGILNRMAIRKKEEILRKNNVGVVCLSEEMKKKFLLKYPFLATRITIIPNPVDSAIFYPVKNSHFSTSILKVAYLGGFSDRRKGYDLLIEALAKCEEEFIVAAPGFEGTLVTGKNSQIKLIGRPRIANENQMNKLFSEVEFTVVPSRKEGLPQAATESLMSGTPVVSFKVGGLIDVVTDDISGFKVDNFDINKLASTMDYCIRSKVKNKLQTQHFASQRFSSTIVGKSYLRFSKTLKN